MAIFPELKLSQVLPLVKKSVDGFVKKMSATGNIHVRTNHIVMAESIASGNGFNS
jgi:hypothetical protein